MGNHYKTLGLSQSASDDEIREAYRQQVMLHHPDLHPEISDASAFREIQDAYSVLGDPARRREYDRSRETRSRPQPQVRVSVKPFSSPPAWSSWSTGTQARPRRRYDDWGSTARPPVWPKDEPSRFGPGNSADDLDLFASIERMAERLRSLFFGR